MPSPLHACADTRLTCTLALARGKMYRLDLSIPEIEAQYLDPLPREHDNPIAMHAGDSTHGRLQMRRVLIDHLSRMIAAELMNTLEKADPRNGRDRS